MPIQTEKDLSDKMRPIWLKAKAAFEQKNYGYAISLIQNVLKEHPGYLDGRKVLRAAAVQQVKGKKKSSLMTSITGAFGGGGAVKKDPLAAMELAEKSLESDPYNVQANTLLKDAAKAAGYPEIAVFALQTIIEGSPKDTKVMHELAQHLQSMGESGKAVEVYNKIVSINPADLVASKLSRDASAMATMKDGGWEKANSYRDVMKSKEEAQLLEDQGKTMRSQEAVEGQLAEFMPRWEADQSNVDITRRLAKLWEELHEYKKDPESLHGALFYYEHANVLINKSDANIVRKISDLRLKDLDSRIKQWEEWFATGGEDHPEAEQHRAELEELKKQRGEWVVSEAKHRVERNPTDLQLRFELGELLLSIGNHNDAIPELQRARQNPNTRLRAMSLLGRCFVIKGMADLAAQQFKAAAAEMTAMDNVKKDTLYELALVYEKMGKREDYLNCLKEIIEVDYSYKDAAKRVEDSYSGGGVAA